MDWTGDSDERYGEEPIGRVALDPDDVTPRGWVVAVVAAAVLLALVAILLGALLPY